MRVRVEQGCSEWLSLRRSKITATDLSAILGISPYKSGRDLWLDKLGEGAPFVSNPAIERGNKLEPVLREWYEHLKGERYPPAVIVHDDEPWAMASLDGINKADSRLLEIKTVGKNVFQKAKNGGLPDHFISQAQWQLFCCPQAKSVEFVCEWKDDKCLVNVPRDDLYIEKVSAIAKDWYDRYLVGDEEPPLSDRDYLNLSEDLEFACISAEARLVYTELKELESQWKAIKQRLLDCTDGGSARGCGITISNTTRKGSIDTDKLAEDHAIDLEKYRKPSTTSTRISVNLKWSDDAPESF